MYIVDLCICVCVSAIVYLCLCICTCVFALVYLYNINCGAMAALGWSFCTLWRRTGASGARARTGKSKIMISNVQTIIMIIMICDHNDYISNVQTFIMVIMSF